jgi:hypothetical protein
MGRYEDEHDLRQRLLAGNGLSPDARARSLAGPDRGGRADLSCERHYFGPGGYWTPQGAMDHA